MIGYLIVAAIDFIVAAYALIILRTKTSAAFAALWIAFGIWEFNLFLASSISDVSTLSIWFHPLRAGMFFIAPCILTFFCVVTKQQNIRWLKTVTYLSFAISTILTIAASSFAPSNLVPGQIGFETAPDLISTIHEINFIAACLLTIGLTAIAYKNAIYREKRRIKWLLLSVSIGSIFGILSFNQSKLFGMAGNLIGLSTMLYAIVRFRVSNISFVLSNLSIKSISVLFLLSLYLAIEYILSKFSLSTAETITIKIVTIVVSLELYGRIKNFLVALKDKYFFKQYYDLNFVTCTITQLFGQSHTFRDLKAILDAAIIGVVKVESYRVHLASNVCNTTADHKLYEVNLTSSSPLHECQYTPTENDNSLSQWMSKHTGPVIYDEIPCVLRGKLGTYGSSAFVPVFHENTLIAILELGRPIKSEEYSHNDVKLLTWLSHQLPPILMNTINREELTNNLDEAEKIVSLVGRINEVGHDIKTPLLNIEAVVQSRDLFDCGEADQMIIEQVRKANTLVSTMTKMLKGRQKDELQSFDLNAVIECVANSFPTYRSIMNVSLDNTLPSVFGYEREIEMVISNLIKNAIEAKSSFDPKITIKSWQSSENETVYVSIHDNGMGIAEHRLNTLFERKQTTKAHTGGSGLGLSVVKRIIFEHGGNVSVKSEEGNGATFEFSLPTDIVANDRMIG